MLAPTSRPRTDGRPSTLRVLVVDPSIAEVRRLQAMFAGDTGFLLQSARSAEDARGLLEGGCFDAALVDYGLWAEEGAHLVRLVRERRPDVAIILLTSSENVRDAVPALKLGANDFIDRGNMDRDQLAARVLAAVEETRATRRRETMVRWLEREARTDNLTGLLNRRAFDERLQEACAESRESGRPLAVVLADVSGTRLVNDAYGPDAGDAMIRRAAAAIASCIRTSDAAARVGGDEFGIVLRGADLDVARRVARRVAHALERLNESD
ncbi:MAG: diguanylate cyclase, partial [Dehalococcoidia bacterium]|nr:diguanylate cyclase [Dehalococcoidia bacterium]